MESHQALADLGIRARIKLASLGIAEKVINGVEAPPSVFHGHLLHVSSMADTVVNRTAVRTLLLRSVKPV
jgi:hypothetical protein